MLVHIYSDKISIEVLTKDELHMVLVEALGTIRNNRPEQQEISHKETQIEHNIEIAKQPILSVSHSPSMKERLKELYLSFPDESIHRKVLQTLAQTGDYMTNHRLREILGFDKNQQVAAVMSPFSRKEDKFGVQYKDIILSEKRDTPQGYVQIYSLSKSMREAMKELGFSHHTDEDQTKDKRFNIAEHYLSRK